MKVKIGVTYSVKEIELELAEDVDRAVLKAEIDAVLADDDRVLWLEDRQGREVAVPAAKVAYVELASPSASRSIGFSA